MRDPFTWSFPMGRLSGIAIRVHWLFPLVVAGLILRVAYGKGWPPNSWIDASMVMALLFFVVLVHEFGHCFGGRLVGGEAHEVLLWPLGGLAFVEVPHTPRANFITIAAGPATNLVICLISSLFFLVLTDFELRPTWNPFWYPFRDADSAEKMAEGAIRLCNWAGADVFETHLSVIVLARLFWVSWILFLLNVLIIGFPMDGGKMFQSLLWPRLGYQESMKVAIYLGFIFMALIGVIAVVFNEVMLMCLALFIGLSGWRQWILLITGGEESMFGYDFSQGYTSLERDQPPPAARRRKPNFFRRWLQQRAARKLQREQEVREAEERRMDELLEKVQRDGLQALTDEERRFLKRVSDRYRNRQ